MLQEIQEVLIIKLAFQGTTYRIFFSNKLRCVRVYEILVYHTVTSWRYILAIAYIRDH